MRRDAARPTFSEDTAPAATQSSPAGTAEVSVDHESLALKRELQATMALDAGETPRAGRALKQAAWHRQQAGQVAIAAADLLGAAKTEAGSEARAAGVMGCANILIADRKLDLAAMVLRDEISGAVAECPRAAARLTALLGQVYMLDGKMAFARRAAEAALRSWRDLGSMAELSPADWQGWFEATAILEATGSGELGPEPADTSARPARVEDVSELTLLSDPELAHAV